MVEVVLGMVEEAGAEVEAPMQLLLPPPEVLCLQVSLAEKQLYAAKFVHFVQQQLFHQHAATAEVVAEELQRKSTQTYSARIDKSARDRR